MPAPLLPKDQLLDRLLETFRSQGYDGASIATLSEATGLGRSSLYHYFPGGKEQMVAEVMARLEGALEETLFGPLRAPGPPAERLDAMLRGLAAFYDDGRKACLLERLCASVDAARFGDVVGRQFAAWVGAVEQLGVDAGLPADVARERAEDAVLRVEGALVLAAGRGDPAVFVRTLDRLRRTLLTPEGTAPAPAPPGRPA
jgi:AcrR family transcriptional regulator